LVDARGVHPERLALTAAAVLFQGFIEGRGYLGEAIIAQNGTIFPGRLPVITERSVRPRKALHREPTIYEMPYPPAVDRFSTKPSHILDSNAAFYQNWDVDLSRPSY
jgi:hypothetical protein